MSVCSWVLDPEVAAEKGKCGAPAVRVLRIQNIPMPPNDGFPVCADHVQGALAWADETYGSDNVVCGLTRAQALSELLGQALPVRP